MYFSGKGVTDAMDPVCFYNCKIFFPVPICRAHPKGISFRAYSPEYDKYHRYKQAVKQQYKYSLSGTINVVLRTIRPTKQIGFLPLVPTLGVEKHTPANLPEMPDLRYDASSYFHSESVGG